MQQALQEIRLSVRELAEYACQDGDLIGARASLQRVLDGAAAHRRLQKNQPEGYQSEVALSISIEKEGYLLIIEGRADGVLVGEPCMIHEIKTTYLPLEELSWEHYPSYHAQLWVYGFIYALEHGLDGVLLRLTYHNLQNGKSRDLDYYAEFSALAARFNELVDDYCRISDNIVSHRLTRDRALSELTFPFGSYRPSQLELAQQVFLAVKNKNTLYVQAPTGTGKTAATLFPALKALGMGHCKRIFYLTAKNQTASVAVNTLEIMRKSGLALKSVCITAKDKACLCSPRSCTPEDCPYCRDYYSRLHKHLPQILKQSSFTPERIMELGKQYELCPFELSLAISQYCDCIICDYNYVFHPNIRFKRYFSSGKRDSVFLIDEAHNLVERARDIFSCRLSQNELRRVRLECKDELPDVARSIKKLEDAIKGAASAKDEEGFLLDAPPDAVYGAAAAVLERISLKQEEPISQAVSELSLKLSDYVMVAEHYDASCHSCYILKQPLSLNILCLYTGKFVRAGLELGLSSVLFSATISPSEYYMHMLGANERSYHFELPSPFEEDNLLVVVDDAISTSYSSRASAYLPIAKRIRATIRAKKGNYIAFFPSYAFMESVLAQYKEIDGKTPLAVHRPGMTKAQKDEFIYKFENEDGVLGFSVLGGHFGEGIDLPGERLIGAIIVGVGLPQLSPERNLIKGYFDACDMDGYGYAYVYPGFNRVLQAAGRVIRTDTDRGVVVLIDSRYAMPPYIDMMPDHWQVHYLSQEERSCKQILLDFWEG